LVRAIAVALEKYHITRCRFIDVIVKDESAIDGLI